MRTLAQFEVEQRRKGNASNSSLSGILTLLAGIAVIVVLVVCACRWVDYYREKHDPGNYLMSPSYPHLPGYSDSNKRK